MTLRFAGEPIGAADVIHRALVRNARGGRSAGARPRELATLGTGPDVNLAVPHPVFDLTLADVAAAGSTIRNARPGLWRYLLMEGSAAVGSAEVAVDDGGNAERVSILNTGPFVAATERGIRYAERLPQVQRDAYELRLLRIPALYVLALWLKHAVDVNDIIVPLAPAPRYLVPERPYGPLEFLQALRGPAKDRLGFDDTPRDVVR